MKRHLFVLSAALFAATVIVPAPELPAGEPFLLNGGETVLFFGDSITQNGGYVNYFEAYLLTRFPEKSFPVINHGISSETISGTSEPDHDPRRPWALMRFQRDVTRWQPDVVVACFGMNDGNYHPFDLERFEKYQAGIRELMRRTRHEAEARLILMTPPPFDPYRRRVSDPDAIHYGYKFPAVDYDATLKRYSRWLVSLRSEGRTVVDLHTPMNAHLQQRRKERVSFHLSPDAVHPNSTGHWLMAQNLLLEMRAPSTVAELHVDVGKVRASGGRISDLKLSDSPETPGRHPDVVSFRWTSPIPMPMDPDWDAASVALANVSERLNRYRLKVTGLPDYKRGYGISANGKRVAVGASAEQLAGGIDLLTFKQLEETWPANRTARELLSLVKRRRRAVYSAWRAEIAGRQADPETEPKVRKLTARIQELRKPQAIEVAITPSPGN